MSISEKITLAGETRLESDTIEHGVYTITASQNIDLNWSHYSKSWHRAHGPKVNVYNRRVVICRPWGNTSRSFSMHLNSWAGDFVARAVIDAGLAPKKPRAPVYVRLNKAYDAQITSVKRGYTFYERTLLGETVDYVIVSPLGMVYHDADRANLVRGLHNKIRQQTRKLKGLVDWQACRKLGFCKEGIREFCSIFGFDTDSSYTLDEIEKNVRRNSSAAAPFISELHTLANSLNYHWSM